MSSSSSWQSGILSSSGLSMVPEVNNYRNLKASKSGRTDYRQLQSHITQSKKFGDVITACSDFMGLTLVFLFFGLICFLSFSSCSPPTSCSSLSPNILAAFLFGKSVLRMSVLSRCRSRISSWLVKRFEIPHFLGTTNCFWPSSQERSGSGSWRWRHPCNLRQASLLIMLWG